MLATVQPSPSQLDSATQSITLTYNSLAPNPEFQLTFGNTDTGQPFLFITEETTVTVTLINATFAENQVTWISPSSGFNVTSISDQQISIQITEAPAHYFDPWSLSFNVNAVGVFGLNSPPLFLVLQPSSLSSISIDLLYSLSDGSFVLDSAISLANLSILINSIIPFVITFNLVADPSVTFNSTPIIGPSWLTYTLDSTHTVLTASISSTPNRFGSFQFALDIQTTSTNTVTITSPDPILINSTIGDG